jgi:hypothetical protein
MHGELHRQSSLAPLYIGCRTCTEDGKEVAAAFGLAARIVPMTVVRRKVRIGGRDVGPLDHLRTVRVIEDELVAVCADRVPGHDDFQVHEVWRAAMQYSCVAQFSPMLPTRPIHIRLSVMSFEVHQGVLDGAPQLALMRALFVRSLSSIDPDLITVGGQCDWDPAYWKFAVQPSIG